MERIRMICHYRGFEDVESKAANITMVKEGDYLCMNISPGSDDILVTLIELDTRHRNRPVRA
ncbi:MAG: hypothetical protein HY367_02430 [Candidatus Aenigmarchaeota archaeon]|nr:hypothetical protein [Candidatus Aenigmarchaeota archaeon]